MSNDELLDAIAAEPPEVVDLSVVRKAAVTLRDNYLVKNDLENQLKEIDTTPRIVNAIERNLHHYRVMALPKLKFQPDRRG